MIKYVLTVSLIITSPLFAMEEGSKKRSHEELDKLSTTISENDAKKLKLLAHDTAFKALYRAGDIQREYQGQEKEIVDALLVKRAERRRFEASPRRFYLQSEREKLEDAEAACLSLYEQLEGILPDDNEIKDAKKMGEKLAEFIGECMKPGCSFEMIKSMFVRTDND